MQKRKIPLRRCVACQELKDKKQLLRIVKTPNDEVMIDVTGKISGRGAYLCGSVHCLKSAKKTGALDRALKTKVSFDIYQRLENEFIFGEHDE